MVCKCGAIARVSDPHPFLADPDPGFEKFADADPDPGCEKFADPDPYPGCEKCADPDPDPGLHFY